MWIKRDVVMLPTNEKAKLGLLTVGLRSSEKYIEPIADGINQHLYFLSDEEIKEADWCLTGLRRFRQCNSFTYSQDGKTLNGYLFSDGTKDTKNNCKKIIATTDYSLGIDVIPRGFKSGVGALSHKRTINLPEPSQYFLEEFVGEFNEGNLIKEVMVEYEIYFGGLSTRQAAIKNKQFQVNVNQDNTINIERVKDSWTNKERLEFTIAFADHCLKEAGIEDMQLIGKMIKFEKNWDKN
jgi:hypothetical protein